MKHESRQTLWSLSSGILIAQIGARVPARHWLSQAWCPAYQIPQLCSVAREGGPRGMGLGVVFVTALWLG